MFTTATGLLLRLLLGESGEELHLRLEVSLHRAVKIEMVLGQVREDRDVPFEAARAVLRKRVRGNFHRRRFAAGVHHLREQFLQFERLRRRADSRQNALADFVAHGADEAAAQPGVLADVLEQKRRGRFAVRAGHGGHLEPAHRAVVKRARPDRRARVARIRHLRRRWRAGCGSRRSVTITVAPLSTAWSMNWWPSLFSPRSATKSPFFCTRRES